MSFDYGSIDLGIKNPFKTEGKISIIRGIIIVALGAYLLFQATSIVKDNQISGWILMFFGISLFGAGLVVLSKGTYAILRYFVGRNHPTSLAKNYNKAQQSSSYEEERNLAYNASNLEEMLMGRKNITFLEPKGILNKALYTFFTKLLFMPFPIRNMAQKLYIAWIKTAISLIAYALVVFVTKFGFAGDIGTSILPIYTVFLLVYLVNIWRLASKHIDTDALPEDMVTNLGVKFLTKTVAISMMAPVVIGLVLSSYLSKGSAAKKTLETIITTIESFAPFYFVAGILILVTISTILTILMLKKRLKYNAPVVEVSELRENWQESIHPNEIFVNLDNLVMANRRYKEVPNRIYRELEPYLREEVHGKGVFGGEMIQEIQPKVKEIGLDKNFKLYRLISLITGNIILIASSIAIFFLAYNIVDINALISKDGISSLSDIFKSNNAEHRDLIIGALQLFLDAYILKIFGSILSNFAHIMYAEIQFESMLVYFKIEGTFTESKISTGTSIHDSTRSENTLVRSSITPWIIVSKIVSTTFASTGTRNLEHPRYILEMRKNEQELENIKSDIIKFLKDRESIASITNIRDLNNTAQIYTINENSRANIKDSKYISDSEAGGYIEQNSMNKTSNES